MWFFVLATLLLAQLQPRFAAPKPLEWNSVSHTSLSAIRAAIRGPSGRKEAPNSQGEIEFKPNADDVKATDFKYIIHPISGCVTKAEGYRGLTSDASGFSDATIKAYCSVAAGATTGLSPPKGTGVCDKTIEQGHILGKALGGTSKDPINLFPQTKESNHGPWIAFELGLQQALDLKDPHTKATVCTGEIFIRILFDNCTPGSWEFVQPGGTYVARIEDKVCWEAMQNAPATKAMLKAVVNATAPAAAGSDPSTATKATPIYRATVWTNSYVKTKLMVPPVD